MSNVAVKEFTNARATWSEKMHVVACNEWEQR